MGEAGTAGAPPPAWYGASKIAAPASACIQLQYQPSALRQVVFSCLLPTPAVRPSGLAWNLSLRSAVSSLF